MKFARHAKAAILLGVATTMWPLASNAAKAPNPLLTDDRVKQIAYDQNQVYEIVGTYGYQTAIEFSAEETVKVVSLGDSIAWQTVPYANRLFIKPVEPNAATNLTVITDKRTYYFKLNSAKSRSTQTFLVRFVYAAPPIASNSRNDDRRDQRGIDPDRLNINYGAAGDKADIPLQQAFDDGQFTYFRFAPNAEIPSVYAVASDGTESIVNTRREGTYLVVERTASLFTLRNGGAHLCVHNNANPFQRSATRRQESGGV